MEDIRERWQGMMRYDCTTCWEVFPGFYEVGRTRSYCHSWSASPVYFFGKYVLGIHPREQAFQRVEILLPEVDIEWCEGSVPTPYGAIRVSWSREDNKRICQVVAPKAIIVETPTDTDWDIRVTYFDA